MMQYSFGVRFGMGRKWGFTSWDEADRWGRENVVGFYGVITSGVYHNVPNRENRR